MNGAHLHLIINHFPIIGLIFSLALLAVALVRRSPELVRAGVVALVVLAVISIPVYLTGEPAEEIVENLPGVSDAILERHEEAGLISLIALEVLGAVALVGLVVFRGSRSPARQLGPALLVLGLLAAGWVGWTSYLGGQINHAETRPDFDLATAGVCLDD